MGHDTHQKVTLVDKFKFDAKARNLAFIFLGIGIAFILLGVLFAGSPDKKAGHEEPKHHSAANVPVPASPFVKTFGTEPDQHVQSDSTATDTAAHVAAKDTTAHAVAPAHSDSHGASHGHEAAPGHDAHAGGHGHGDNAGNLTVRILANLLLNNVLFTAIAVISIFWIAIQYAVNAGWFTQLIRIPEAMGYYLFIGPIILLAVYFLGKDAFYHWLHPEGDKILLSKVWYLNEGFFLGREIVFFVVWIAFFLYYRSVSLKQDIEGGMSHYNKLEKASAVFIFFFAVSICSFAWDWFMSLEAHWFSTMYGVYLFASALATTLAFITLIAIYLKGRGYLPFVNMSHFHDLGKFVFGFSVFWAYIWFSQFILIWYANIPEEGIYFVNRLTHYPVQFFGAFFICFVIPFFTLLSKGNMRNLTNLAAASIIVIFGHWLDFYNMTFPGIFVNGGGGFGLLELGFIFLFTGIFLFMTFTFLARAPLHAKNHPYMDESVFHHYA